MEQLIKIEERYGIQTVNARDLHEFLESKRNFSDWIKQRIEKYGFVENQDYVKHDNFVELENSNLKRPQIDYHISIDMAKELAMVENNQKGREARQYFIAVEKAYKENKNMVTDNSIILETIKLLSQ